MGGVWGWDSRPTSSLPGYLSALTTAGCCHEGNTLPPVDNRCSPSSHGTLQGPGEGKQRGHWVGWCGDVDKDKRGVSPLPVGGRGSRGAAAFAGASQKVKMPGDLGSLSSFGPVAQVLGHPRKISHASLSVVWSLPTHDTSRTKRCGLPPVPAPSAQSQSLGCARVVGAKHQEWDGDGGRAEGQSPCPQGEAGKGVRAS